MNASDFNCEEDMEGKLNECIHALKEAKERLEGVLQVCEFIDDEEQHQTKATQSTLYTINQALEGT